MKQRVIKRLAAAALLVLAAGPALAVEPDEMLADPALEARAREISKELRCVVCQSQSIDDSDAPLAKDLRLLVRERLVAGDSNEAVIDYVADRYGDYVLLRPRVKSGTIVLWAAPAIALLGGAALFFWRMRETGAKPRPAPLTASERKILSELEEKSDS